ncbi:FMN-binding domain-containing protein [Alcanivorax nanhaiticus]|uniref:FMN-binding domain-containing protein n=1 Tax=Alcanivorax nanhaiticus TaxID=1177154 RepID=A0A095SMZ2_9GAMM|nr:FMN-binding protein [Alcanivorax nanhaiticus]KGD66041.1 FMN-binding domain-containing protein [Alcanivorax nanhaiticus]
MTAILFRASIRLVGVLMLAVSLQAQAYDETEYLKPEAFLAKVYGSHVPGISLMPLRGETRKKAEAALGHGYSGMRLRYWEQEGTTAWIIDEKSKDMPMTIGVGVSPAGEIAVIELLVYREPRGGEIHQAAFRQQYLGLSLTEDNGLSAEVDGITGATLSVDALNRVAAMALVLHQAVAGNR